MCGIAGFHLKKKELVKRHDQMELFANLLLTGIEARGRQATGFVAVTHDGKKIAIDKQALNAKEFVNVRKALPEGTRTFLGHTRLATQGSNENNANLHPVIAGTCFATHNGTIWNDDTLFEEQELKRNAEVDTEIIPALIHKFGWEKAAEALHHLKGSFAIAALDIKHPGEVLLAKGDWSPLHWIETDNFVVWASTITAMRDAWKEVLGTPPNFKKFNSLVEGDILWLRGDAVEEAKFELPSDPFRRADNPKRKTSESSGKQQKALGPGRMRPIFARGSRREGGFASTSHSRGVVPDRREAVQTLRHDGNGKAHIYKETTKEQALEVSSTLTWHNCAGCNELILGVDFVDREGEGRICIDCDYIAEWGNSGKLVIDDTTKEHLTKWVKRELRAHTPALFEVAHQTGLDVAVIDYLVFRLPEKTANNDPTLADLAAKLDDLYQEAHQASWDLVLDEANQRGSEDDRPAPSKPWTINTGGNCFWIVDKNGGGGRYQATSSCNGKACGNPHCPKKVHPITAAYATEKCDACDRYRVKGKACVWCLRRVRTQTADDTKDGNTTIRVDKCWCGEDADKAVGGLAGFCHYHYVHCNEEKCEWGLSQVTKTRGVRAKANHILPSGKRVCHHHARSQEGAYSDTLLEQRGVKIRELRVHEPAGL